MRNAFVPLDERPLNTRYLQMLARIVGIELLQHPVRSLSTHMPVISAMGVYLQDFGTRINGLSN